ncbi:MAG: PqqD family protein [Deltaproteobacteria bacterium]|nr:PqqD family protein [Deltaproteobacteria bacterium]
MSIEAESGAPDRVVRRLAVRLKEEPYSMVRLTDGTGVLLDLRGMSILTLNETAVVIVTRMLEGETSPARLVAAVMAEFDVSEGTAVVDVEEFLNRLDSATSSPSDQPSNAAAR